jgi:hypothetical protein
VQHVIGISDPLTALEARDADVPDDDLPVALEEWIEKEKVRWFKLKVKGSDVKGDLQRIVDVYRVAAECAWANGIRQPVRYEIDPNEGCADPEPMIELLRKLRETDPAAYEALVYIEQPTSRNLAEYPFTLHEISKYKPVLADESLDDLEHLQHMERLGWSGVALKTCKGQSHAIITYCWARQKGVFISLQDFRTRDMLWCNRQTYAVILTCPATGSNITAGSTYLSAGSGNKSDTPNYLRFVKAGSICPNWRRSVCINRRGLNSMQITSINVSYV